MLSTDGLLETAPGSVFVFNMSGEDMTFSLNGISAGAADAWQMPIPGDGTLAPGAAIPFAANGFQVPRTRNPEPGKFFLGSNKATVEWSEGPYDFGITLKQPLGQSFGLYIIQVGWMLMDMWGTLIDKGTLLAEVVMPFGGEGEIPGDGETPGKAKPND